MNRKPRSDGTKIRQARWQAGVKSAPVADGVGIARQTLYNAESNDAPLSIEVVHRIAEFLGCDVSDLTRDEDENEDSQRVAS